MIRALRTISVVDPQPELHESICDPKDVAKIAETEAVSVPAVLPKKPTVNDADDEPSVPSPLLAA